MGKKANNHKKMPKFINVNGCIYKRLSNSEIGAAIAKGHADEITGGKRTFAAICDNQYILHGENLKNRRAVICKIRKATARLAAAKPKCDSEVIHSNEGGE